MKLSNPTLKTSAYGALLASMAVIAGCGGGTTGGSSIGGDTGTPSTTLTLNTAATTTVVSGQTASFQGAANSYPNDITKMAWTVRLDGSTSQAKPIVLGNDQCTDISKSVQATPSGHQKTIATCAVTLSPPAGITTPTAYRLVLTTTDAKGNTANSSTLVTVTPAAGTTSEPTATINAPTTTPTGGPTVVTCDATGGYTTSPGQYTYKFVTKPDTTGTTTGATYRFSAPAVAVPTNIEVQCRATDSNNATAVSTAVIGILPPTPGATYTNILVAPNVAFGSTVASNAVISLDASGSSYFDGVTNTKPQLFYRWRQTSGPAANISASTSALATITMPTAAATRSQATFELMVSPSPIDDSGNTVGASKTTSFSYFLDPLPAIRLSSGVTANLAPSAYSTVPVIATLSPSGGQQIYYKWTQIGGPAVAFGGGNSNTIDFVSPANPSSSPLQLNFNVVAGFQPITDSYTGVASLDMVATVAPGGQPPGLTISIPSNGPLEFKSYDYVQVTASVSGNASGRQVYWSWKQIAGPSVTLGGSTSPTVSFIAPNNATATPIEMRFTVAASYSAITPTSSPDATFDVLVSVKQ